MPVLMIGEVPNLTEEIYGGMLEQMKPLMRAGEGVHRPLRRAESEWRVACRRDVGVRRGRPDMVRRERQAQPSASASLHPKARVAHGVSGHPSVARRDRRHRDLPVGRQVGAVAPSPTVINPVQNLGDTGVAATRRQPPPPQAVGMGQEKGTNSAWQTAPAAGRTWSMR